MPTLYIVSTPIGNLGDITARAAETLRNVDFIAAEDTRVTRGLLSYLGISKPLVSYYEHNMMQRGEEIIGRILRGESCALVSDAGTPAVSDPGEYIARQCRENDIEVIPIPGCCAAVAALSCSGMPSGRFCFEGFLSTNRRNRAEHLESLRCERRTMIFYEAPHKLRTTLKDLSECFGHDRRIFVARELTKLYEEHLDMTIGEAAEHFAGKAPRGEFVLVVAGYDGEPPVAEKPDAVKLAREYIAQGMSRKDAAHRASAETGEAKNKIYAALIGREDA